MEQINQLVQYYANPNIYPTYKLPKWIRESVPEQDLVDMLKKNPRTIRTRTPKQKFRPRLVVAEIAYITKLARMGHDVIKYIANSSHEVIAETIDILFKQIRSLRVIPKEIKKILSNSSSKRIIDLLRYNPDAINYRVFSANPAAFDLLIKNPYMDMDMLANIQTNPHPEIIRILEAISNDMPYASTNNNLTILHNLTKWTMGIVPAKVISNPGATHIVEQHLEYLDYLYEDPSGYYLDDIELPDNITEKIADKLNCLIKTHGYIHRKVLCCNSPRLIQIYEEHRPNFPDDISHIVSNNEYIF